MARKAGATKKAGAAKKKAGGAKTADVPKRIVDTALKLAAERGWRDLSLAEIAEAAKLPLSQVYPLFPSKRAILVAFSRRIDADVLAGQEPGAREGSARDRLFDVVMRRFDALAPHKAAVANILHDLARDPMMACGARRQFRRSMDCMLEAADLSAAGLRGAVRRQGLVAVYLATLGVWLRDDTPDLARTMAILDRRLRRIEGLAKCLSQVREKRPGAAPAAA